MSGKFKTKLRLLS